MGILDLFKKKKEVEQGNLPEKTVESSLGKSQEATAHSTVDETPKTVETPQQEEKPIPSPATIDTNNMSLGELFETAFKDPKLRIEFYKRLPLEDLYILTSPATPVEGSDQEMKWEIIKLDSGEIPLFTSEDKVYDNNVVKEKLNAMPLKLRQIYDATRGAVYVLNPFSNIRKVFVQDEVEQTISGKIWRDPTPPSQETKRVRLGQPAFCPQEMVDALKEKLSAFPAVMEVYIALMEFPEEPNEPPHFAFGVHGGLNQEVAHAVGNTVAPFLKDKGNVDVIPINRNNKDGLNAYFFSKEPIYTNSSLS